MIDTEMRQPDFRPNVHPWSRRSSVFPGEKDDIVNGINIASISIWLPEVYRLVQNSF